MAEKFVAAPHRPYAGRRSGKDEIAWLQLEQAGEIGDHLRHLPDHLVEIAGSGGAAPLTSSQIAPGRRMADLGRRHERRAGCGGCSKALPIFPWPARLLCLDLAGRGASCRDRRHSHRRNPAPSSSGMSLPPSLQRHDQLDLVMNVIRRAADRGNRRPSTMLSGFFWKKNGGSRSGSPPISIACAA